MNKPSEHEMAQLKRDGKKLAKTIKNCQPEQRAYLFSSMSNEFDRYGEVSMCTLFAGIAGTYLKRMRMMAGEKTIPVRPKK